MTNDVVGDRFVLREDDGSWWEVGWDRHLATYWAQHLTTDAYGVEQILAWHGADPSEAPTLNALTTSMGRPLPRDIAQDLQRIRLGDQALRPRPVSLSDWTQARPERRVPHVDFGSRWIDSERPDVEHRVSWVPTTGELYAVDRRSGDGVQLLAVVRTQDELNRALVGWAAVAAGNQPHLTWLQQRLEQVVVDGPETAEAPDQRTFPEVRLTAAPAAAALASLVRSPGFDDDPTRIAQGLSLDRGLVTALLAGTKLDLGVEEIAAVCEAFHCSPFDLWEPDVARTLLQTYGPERWPRHIEPLDELKAETDDCFIRRRLDAQTQQLVSVRAGVLAGAVHATCYRATGLLALDMASGSTQSLTDGSAASEPDHEYHFTFRQIARTLALRNDGEFGEEHLTMLADRLQGEPWLAATALVRFVEPMTGGEQWLGKSEPNGEWETWDDPRRYYPGKPEDVLDPSIHELRTLEPCEIPAMPGVESPLPFDL